MIQSLGGPRKIRERIRRYERKLRAEKYRYGDYDDGAGKRHFIGPLYLLLGDNEGALAAVQQPGDVRELLRDLRS